MINIFNQLIIYPSYFAYTRWAAAQIKNPRLPFPQSCAPGQSEDIISPPGPGPSLRAHPGAPPSEDNMAASGLLDSLLRTGAVVLF